MKLWRFMQMDTCPICGNEIWVTRDNPHLGEKDVEKIPGDTVFVFECVVPGGGLRTCGEFRISRVNPATLEDDWKCEYVLIGEDFL